MADSHSSRVIIKQITADLKQKVDDIITTLAPRTFSGATVLVKPNMVGPSVPELGHTTHPELLEAVISSCLDRNAKVIVGDNPGGINRSSHNVAAITGILDASHGCFVSISERVVEVIGSETGFNLVISRAVLDADYVINIPVFKTHIVMMVTGAIKNTFGYVAGACKARLHLNANTKELFADTICDIHQVRPPDLNIMDAITVIEGNGPCHGGHLRKVNKLLASTDSLALDAVMTRMMGVYPSQFPIQKQAAKRGLGAINETELDIEGKLVPIPDFKMPITFTNLSKQEKADEIRKLFPTEVLHIRIKAKPEYHEEQCAKCEDCVMNCPAQAITIEPEFFINDECIACFCCVELCPKGALEVPDLDAFHHY